MSQDLDDFRYFFVLNCEQSCDRRRKARNTELLRWTARPRYRQARTAALLEQQGALE